MADEFGERTEPATPRRRQEARNKGQVAKSQDLPAAIVLLAAIVTIDALGGSIWNSLLSLMQGTLDVPAIPSAGELAPLSLAVFIVGGKAILPFLAVVLAASLAAVYWQVGFLFTWRPVTPSLAKLNPLQGFKRMFSARTAVSALVNVGKVTLLSALAYWTLAAGVKQIIFSLNMDYMRLYAMAAALLIRLALRLAAAMVILALLDYWYQRYRHEKDLRMSKEEIKEELKRMEGDPLMKRRRREVQMRLALQRVQREVPKADVIVTNPTHYAIALRYDPKSMAAPRVVAKGVDWMALRIRQIAAAAGVPIVERRELARMMYDAVEVGQTIPQRFYAAVAEILAYVYELSGRRLGPRPVAVGA
jgi:flagellar biosynthetic protein FlhB